MRTVIAYGLFRDPHIGLVRAALKQRGITLWHFDPTRTDPLTVKFSGGTVLASVTLVNEAEETQAVADLSDAVVWIRNKAARHVIRTEYDQDMFFRIAERGSAFRALLEVCGARTFNPLRSLFIHEDKLLQLQLAQQVGFAIPETLLSNSADEVRAFVSASTENVVKPLNASWIPGGPEENPSHLLIMTSAVEHAEVRAADDASLETAPLLYQRRVRGPCEMRVVATRSGAIFYRVIPPDAASVDWRKRYEQTSFSLISPDHAVAAKLSAYLQLAGLHYGVFDLMIDDAGEWLFLECNSDGQWAWLGDGCPQISSLLADLVVEEAGRA